MSPIRVWKLLEVELVSKEGIHGVVLSLLVFEERGTNEVIIFSFKAFE